MRLRKLAETMVTKTREKLKDADYQKKAKVKDEYFTRNRKLGFKEYMLLLLQTSKKSLQVMLNTFCADMRSAKLEYSKQAFSKGRERIKPEAVEELFRMTVQEFYANAQYKTHKGYRVCAIDGTRYNLPKTPELLAMYGSQKSTGGMVQALSSCLYDVMNHVLVDVSIDRFDTSEREHAAKHLQQLQKMRTEKELLLFDRGYPSEDLLYQLENEGFKYLMRCTKKHFFREVRDFDGTDGDFLRTAAKGQHDKPLPFRIVRVRIDPTGDDSEENVVTFITNLDRKSFPETELLELYHMRWGIETKYNEIKNKLYIESFSGMTPTAILQDFWASMYMANLAAAFEYDAEREYDSRRGDKQYLHDKQINRATVIATLRVEFLSIFLEDSKRRRARRLHAFIRAFSKSLVDIVPLRHFPRNLLPSAKQHPVYVKSLS